MDSSARHSMKRPSPSPIATIPAMARAFASSGEPRDQCCNEQTQNQRVPQLTPQHRTGRKRSERQSHVVRSAPGIVVPPWKRRL